VKFIYLKNLVKRIASHKNITNKINQLRKHRKQNTKGWNHIKKTLMTKKKNPLAVHHEIWAALKHQSITVYFVTVIDTLTCIV